MNIWDWKYRIFFDNKIREIVDNWKNSLKEEEKDIYDNIEQFYLSFYSYGILFDLIIEDPSKTEDLLSIAENNLDLIIRVPSVLIPYYKRTIKKYINKESYRNRLLDILGKAINGKDISGKYWEHTKYVLGNSFDYFKNDFLYEKFKKSVRSSRQVDIVGEAEVTFNQMYNEIINNDLLKNNFNDCKIEPFKKSIVDDFGYGEWWDRELTDSDIDELILYANNNVVKRDDYFYTIIHETYPGHGHFYNYVRNDNTAMDHGAMLLIEGWATYCEWNTIESKYIDVIRHNDLCVLYNSYSYDCETRSKLIYDRKIKQGKKVSEFLGTIIYQTQYIGYLESYYLGALWIEYAIKNKYKTAKDFLDMLKNNDKGDFFRLWL